MPITNPSSKTSGPTPREIANNKVDITLKKLFTNRLSIMQHTYFHKWNIIFESLTEFEDGMSSYGGMVGGEGKCILYTYICVEIKPYLLLHYYAFSRGIYIYVKIYNTRLLFHYRTFPRSLHFSMSTGGHTYMCIICLEAICPLEDTTTCAIFV